MLIYEIVQRKNYIKNKLDNLDNYISKLEVLDLADKASLYNKAIEQKFLLLNKYRSHLALLREQNRNTTVLIGKDKLSVEDALYLRNTIQIKIDTLNTIIESGDFKVVNVFSLLEQRDNLFEEYMLLDSTIQESDLNTTWEN